MQSRDNCHPQPIANRISGAFGETHRSPLLALALCLTIFLQSVAIGGAIPRGQPPDEMAHLSYVVDATRSNALLPDYASGKIIGSQQANYLTHPPMYYSAMALISRGAGLDPIRDFVALRNVSAGMVAIGFFFWLMGFRALGVGGAPMVAVTIASCAIPMFSYLGGSINNDNMIYLGIAMAFYGLVKSSETTHTLWDRHGIVILSVGLLITLLGKATGAAFIVFLFGFLTLLRPRRMLDLFLRRGHLFPLITMAAVVAAYYAGTFIRHDGFFPASGALYGRLKAPMDTGLSEFLRIYAGSMWERLPIVMSHVSLAPLKASIVPWFYAMLLAPVAAWPITRLGAVGRGAGRFPVAISDAFMLSSAALLAVHVYMTYEGYLETGLLAGLQPRYFAYLIPALWLVIMLHKPPAAIIKPLGGFFILASLVCFWGSVPFTLAKSVEANHARTATQPESTRISLSSDTGKTRIVAQVINLSDVGSIPNHIDVMQFSGSRLHLRGWAFDEAEGRVPHAIWVTHGDKYLGSAQVSLRRSDVAASLGRSEAVNSGFDIIISGLPGISKQCSFGILAERHDSTFVILRAASC